MAFTEFQMESISGEQIDFSQYEDQLSLVVNVASN